MIELLQRFNFAAGYAACAKTCRVLLEVGSIDFHVYSVGWDASKQDLSVSQTRTLRRRRRIRRSTKQCGWEEEDAKQTSTSSATVHNAEYLCFSAIGNLNICCSNII